MKSQRLKSSVVPSKAKIAVAKKLKSGIKDKERITPKKVNKYIKDTQEMIVKLSNDVSKGKIDDSGLGIKPYAGLKPTPIAIEKAPSEPKSPEAATEKKSLWDRFSEWFWR